MATAKRLYLYAVSGVGLALGLSGAAVMLRTLFNNIGIGPQAASAAASAPDDKNWFAISLGLLVSGLIVWVLHWTWVEQMVAAVKDDDAIAERRSIVRSVYFVAVLGITLYVAASQLVPWVARLIGDVLDAKPLAGADSSATQVLDLVGGAAGSITSAVGIMGAADDSWALAIILVAAAAWGYHAWIRDRDLRQTPLISGAAAWISRHYLYGAALVALIIGLDHIVVIIKTIAGQWAETGVGGSLDTMSGLGSVPVSSDWVRPVIFALIAIVVWGGIWVGHWLYSVRLTTGNSQQAAAERGSRTRLAYMALIIFWAAATVVIGLGNGLGSLLAKLLDAGDPGIPTWYLVFVPVVAAIPAAVAGWWHREQALTENAVGGVPNVSAVRVILYTIAIVGIFALTTGAIDLLQTLVLQVFTKASENAWKVPAAMGVGLGIAGAVAWAWPWMLAQARRVADWQAESTSSSRSYYLYLVLGVFVALGAMALDTLVERYGRIVLSLKDPDLAFAVAPALATGIVAVAVIAYHGWVLRNDKLPPAPKPAPAAAATAPAPARAVAKAPAKKAPAKKAPAKKAPAKKAPAK
jgi:hypothetical protein